MRVLTVGNMYPPHHFGGYEQVWQWAVEHLREQGHEVRVLATTYRHPDIADADTPDVHRELRWYWRDHRFPAMGVTRRFLIERHNHKVFRRQLDEFEPDVIGWFSMGGMSHSLIEAARRSGVPAVAFVHDQWLDYGRMVSRWTALFRGRRQIIGRPIDRLTGLPTRVDYGHAARWVFVSEFVRRRSEALGLSLGDTAVSPSGFDPLFLAPPPPADEPPAWRGKLLYVGRLHPDKGIHDIATALPLLPDASCTFAGTWDEREERELERRLELHGVTERAPLVGHRRPDEVRALMRDADALLFPVVWEEPWGLVPLEAMASGCPVIATGRGGSAEYMRSGENCLIVPPADPAALAAAVGELEASTELRRKLRHGGRATAPLYTREQFNAAVQGHLERRAQRPAARSGLEVSVVIPTYRRPDALPLALTALERQDVPLDSFEVIVVDDSVDDDPDAVEHQVAASSRPYSVRIVHRHDRGVSAARNAGVAAADAPLVLFLGDDILASPQLVREHLMWHDARDGERVGVLGHVSWARELHASAFMRWLERGYQFDYPSIEGDEAGWGYFYTSNISLRRDLLLDVGGFDERRFPFLYEDLDIGCRLAQTGFRLFYNRAAVAEHLHATTLDDWRRRMAAIARAERRWIELRPELEPYFHRRFSEAVARPRATGALRGLIRWLPPEFPLLGRHAWQSADVYFRQQLAPAFMSSWDEYGAAQAVSERTAPRT